MLPLLLLAPNNVRAIPQEIRDGSISTNVPESIENDSSPAATTEIDNYFERNTTSTSSTDSSLSIQRSESTNTPPLWNEKTSTYFKVIGRYSERFNNMDVDQIVSQVVTNDAMLQEQTALLRLDPDTLQRDLKPRTNDDDQAAQLMRIIRESLKEEQSKSSPEEIKGLWIAISYLVMAAIIIVVIFARR